MTFEFEFVEKKLALAPFVPVMVSTMSCFSTWSVMSLALTSTPGHDLPFANLEARTFISGTYYVPETFALEVHV